MEQINVNLIEFNEHVQSIFRTIVLVSSELIVFLKVVEKRPVVYAFTSLCLSFLLCIMRWWDHMIFRGLSTLTFVTCPVD